MVRILGVDHGLARTGLALSDPLAVTCRPLEVIRERDAQRLVERVRQVAEQEDVDEVVVGLPRPLAGGENEQMRAARDFAASLAAAVSAPVRTWDERFTSKLARQSRADHGKKARKEQPLDSLAACHLLQSYLDARSGGALHA